MGRYVIGGSVIGLTCGYVRGWLDNLVMRLVEAFTAIPTILVALLLVSLYGAGLDHVILFLGITGWVGVSRLIRAQVIALRDREVVTAARAMGTPNWRIIFQHILPNAAGPIIVNATLLIGANIILESVLSYFGFGIQPPVSSWGSMISTGGDFFDVDPWLLFIPGLLIFFTVLSFNLVGDGLRDALDPYMTER